VNDALARPQRELQAGLQREKRDGTEVELLAGDALGGEP
jgi:hypothetical protein